MIGITIKVVSDTATPELQRWLQRLGAKDFAEATGPALSQITRDHLYALGPNRKGWPTTRFYEKFADNTKWIPLATGVAVLIPPIADPHTGRQVGFRQRVFGGVIKPVQVKMLAIPISPVSYGHVPSDFPNLFLLKTPKGAYLVQRGEETSAKTGRKIGRSNPGGNVGRTRRAGLNFLFKLMKSVTQDGNREVLPSDATLLTAAARAAERWVVQGEKNG